MTEEPITIWGRQPVLEALRAGVVQRVLLARAGKPSPILESIREAAGASKADVQDVESGEVERLAPGQTTQGVVARATVAIHASARELLKNVPPGMPALILALDQLQDPHNFGALLRSAEAVGVDGVLFTSHRSAPITGVVSKTSAGALHNVPLARVTNLAAALTDLSQEGIWLAGLDGEARQPVFEADLRVPLCLIVGAEGSGLRRLTRERCDFLVRLPMRGRVSSLNASVAGGVALFEALRQRTAPPTSTLSDTGPQVR